MVPLHVDSVRSGDQRCLKRRQRLNPRRTDPPDDRLSDLTQQLIEQDQIRLDLHLSLGVGPNLGHSTQLPKPTLLSA
ncbi:hypothetical protein V6N11_051578 [Hibiscus sabdariffa]|uniref:Uncharacterized protein n=1 Tax=Hibiscus sabdariffa TaxID=183260 RepID=A0ABR2U7U5_9ROSI